ncbi:unnamed protein product [Pleuronectes platessa]|uniref:Uncharacterized protein n=1 Tax=Pleuronectes platessa TaxID=8262 RepID=A0A9N7UPY1_PLEPL|nr:unnamed protein product [Pleuronectes platessa]
MLRLNKHRASHSRHLAKIAAGQIEQTGVQLAERTWLKPGLSDDLFRSPPPYRHSFQTHPHVPSSSNSNPALLLSPSTNSLSICHLPPPEDEVLKRIHSLATLC